MVGSDGMDTAEPASPSPLHRLVDATGVAPAWLGLGVTALALAVFVVIEWAFGRFELASQPATSEGVIGDMRISVAHILAAGYLPTAYLYAGRAARRSAARGAAAGAVVRPPPESERWVLGIAAAVGVGAAVLVALFASVGTVSFRPSTWTAETAWHRLLSPWLGAWISLLTVRIVLDSLRLSAAAASVEDVDLLEPGELRFVNHQGLTNALLWMGLVAGYSLSVVDWQYLPPFLITVGVAVPAALVALALPALGARRAIRRAKERELRFCREAIRGSRRDLEADPGAARRGRLDELVAWERRVEGVREWPFEAATWRRFGLYLLIPLVSWSGGALVERAVDAVLEEPAPAVSRGESQPE